MKITIICHFFNEEYLLPFWLKHHRQFFDHGIMVNYDSMDNSVSIIKELCPSWDIVISRNKYFNRPVVDPEIIDIEENITDGWKVCLNVTEFLFYPDIKTYLKDLKSDVQGIWLKPIALIDKKENRDKELNQNKSIIGQCINGSIGPCPPRWTQYGRLLHKAKNGKYYGEGRHDSKLEGVIKSDDIFHLWYGYAPWNEKFRKRKLQIKTKISPDYNAKDTMGPHLWDDKDLETKFLEFQQYADDIRKDPIVNKYLKFFSEL